MRFILPIYHVRSAFVNISTGTKLQLLQAGCVRYVRSVDLSVLSCTGGWRGPDYATVYRSPDNTAIVIDMTM